MDGMTRWRPEIAAIEGQFIDASNATLLGRTTDGLQVVYKPSAGERPLWDFPPDSLAVREVLAYEVSRAMGLDLVPETVLGDGPYGTGSIQRFVAHDPEFDPVPLVQSGSPRLWPMAAFDVLVNNADRKLGHILDVAGNLVGIDHGLTFHPDDKLRTVLWVFAGVPLPGGVVAALEQLASAVADGLGGRIGRELGEPSRVAFEGRLAALLTAGVHPDPPEDRPPLPWPLY
jgi:uncharacterized repeat protein (TIGR03843 family)